ncbi:hypothetical protein Taro_013314 [Colocasia esculenta]|uniref:non-specific serine/threonine protein kinase n=1 Tax=Colocasia esculenta TaxID=4460 RepID=A0A843UFV2_COLES|nr:hypothetical protein [Colocasia esculenta]
MDATMVVLLVLLWSGWVDGSWVLNHFEHCSGHQIAHAEYPNGYCFFVNGVAVDTFSFCEILGSHVVEGCLGGGPSTREEWRRIHEKYCKVDLPNFNVEISECINLLVELHPGVGRKLLPQLSAQAPIFGELSREPQTHGREHQNHLTPEKVAAAAPGIFLLSCALLCPCFRSRRKDMEEQPVLAKEGSMDSVSSFDVSSTSERVPGTPLRVPGSPLRMPGSPPQVPPTRFSLSPRLSKVESLHLNVNEILKATQNFSKSQVIGEGGCGTVYKAVLPDGQVVAVKRARKEHFTSIRTEFSNEVELLAKIEHLSLVRLLGYIDQGVERIIITEYVPNGTLREHLDGLHEKMLDFNQRIEIAIDIAHGLTYLHLYAGKTIIHRDVKSSNILLTETLRAKVADFGFARIGEEDGDRTHISTKVKGTAGYLDPEYLRTFQLTPKSDVFSFGILLIEILSGRRPVDLRRVRDERVTVKWAFKKYKEGNVREIMDPLLKEVVDEDILKKIFALAFRCAVSARANRPAMKEVGEQLWEIRKDYGRSLRQGSKSGVFSVKWGKGNTGIRKVRAAKS